jgi:hypothetical protein
MRIETKSEEAADRRYRRRRAIVVVTIFGQNLSTSSNRSKSIRQVEQAQRKTNRISDAQWQSIAATVRRSGRGTVG